MYGSAKNFKDALLFLSEIERSRYAVRVESWSVKGQGSVDTGEAAPAGISVEMTVVTVELIDDGKDAKKK